MIKLITVLVTGIPALFAMMVAHLGRKFSTITATFLAMGLLLTTFISCINLLLQSVVSLLAIPAWLAVPVGMFVPANFAVVLSTLVSARICRAAYDWMSKKAELIAIAN